MGSSHYCEDDYFVRIRIKKRDGESDDFVSEREADRLISNGKLEYDTETKWAKDENGIARPVGTYRTNFRYKK
ncbi:MAG: hypothetical protein WA144_15865 [Candidatus Methanoperedens sp.]